jgi:hypothetical protein
VIRPEAIIEPVYPQAPLPDAGIRAVKPGEVASVIGGREVEVTMLSSSANEVAMQFPGGLEVMVRSNTPNIFIPATTSGNSRLQVVREGIVALQGSSFAAKSLVDVTIFSEPTKLGVVTTDANGVFSSELVIPPSVPAGPHTIKLDGVTPDGELFTVSLGVDVLNPRYVDVAGALSDLSASDSPSDSIASSASPQRLLMLLILVALLGIGVLAAWWVVRTKRRNRQDSSVSVNS